MSHGLAGGWASMPVTLLPTMRAKILLGLLSFAVLVAAITIQRPKALNDFDQSFYVMIAYDLDRHGVFSNGVFDSVDSTRQAPPSGMFFVPGDPLLVYAAMKLDARFAKAVECIVMAVTKTRDTRLCDAYATPFRVIHAALLALGVVASRSVAA